MKTALEVLRVTDSKIKERARDAHLIDFKVKRGVDQVKRPFALVIAHVAQDPGSPSAPWSSGRHHEQQIRLYPPFGNRSPAWMTCTCEWHLYSNEVALTVKDSSSIVHSNGKLPRIKNPAMIPMACKHITKVLQKALTDGRVRNLLNKPQDKAMQRRMPNAMAARKKTKEQLEYEIHNNLTESAAAYMYNYYYDETRLQMLIQQVVEGADPYTLIMMLDEDLG